MKLGVTATQRGLADRQKEVLRELLLRFDPKTLVHGDCVGGDADIHAIWLEVFPDKAVEIRPANIKGKRAYCQARIMEVFPELPPLQRNKDIVDNSMVIMGFPGEQVEQVRSGTWSTIRYAKRIGKPVVVIYPEAKKQGLMGPIEEEFNMGKFGERR